MIVKTELFGHTNEGSAFYCDDYPYGRVERCRIRYWLETDPKKGSRFVSQTENPRTKRWNNAKKSTYARVTGAMYLDEKGHVQWTCVTEYTEAKDAEQFALDFPKTIANDKQKSLLVWAAMKQKYETKMAAGEAWITINGVRQSISEEAIQEHKRDADTWARVIKVIKGEA